MIKTTLQAVIDRLDETDNTVHTEAVQTTHLL